MHPSSKLYQPKLSQFFWLNCFEVRQLEAVHLDDINYNQKHIML